MNGYDIRYNLAITYAQTKLKHALEKNQTDGTPTFTKNQTELLKLLEWYNEALNYYNELPDRNFLLSN